jgi:hypothetical protein
MDKLGKTKITSKDTSKMTTKNADKPLGIRKLKEIKMNEKIKPIQITERDVIIIRFLVRFQFCYVDTLARLVDSTPASMMKRLRLLEAHKLVKRHKLAWGLTLWQAKKAGIEMAGLNFKETRNPISFGTIAHTVGLANLAAEFERTEEGFKDILGLGLCGFDTVAEREIRQAQKRNRDNRSSAEMREVVHHCINNTDGAELEEEMADMFVVYGYGGKTGEHVPDLVIKRPRDENGQPQHIAIELELTPKSLLDWKRILRSYRNNGQMFDKVYYITPSKSIANRILKADEEVGLGEKLVIKKYIPTNNSAPFFG